MILGEAIADNLYSLYRRLAQQGLVDSGKAGGFEYVSRPGFGWPNMAYRGDRSAGPANREEIGRLKTAMAAGTCPKLVILEDRGLTTEVQEALGAERLIAATEWVNMALPVGQVAGAAKREGGSENQAAGTPKQGLLQCREIDAGDPEEWGQWSSVVAPVLFRNEALDPLLFNQPADNKRFTLLTGYTEDTAAATCLLHFGDTAGVYMVATLPAFRGKGFGKQMMEYAQAKAAEKGYAFVVLHSTKAGLNFYQQLGFRAFGKLLLYYAMP